MKKYTVVITETLKRKVVVEANNERGALGLVELQWNNGEHTLDYDDFKGAVFTIKNEE